MRVGSRLNFVQSYNSSQICLERNMMLFVGILMLFWSCSESRNMIIKHGSSTSRSVLLRNVSSIIKTDSKEECIQSCRNNSMCSGSILLGVDACVLYSDARCSCPDDAVSVSSELDSRYKIFRVGDGESFVDVRAACHKEGMKLLDINSQHEQDKIKQLIADFKIEGL